MSEYKASTPFNVPVFLLIPTYTTVKGVRQKKYVAENEPFFCSFKTFGGTESNVNGVTVVENTAIIETWYDPRITANCKIRVNDCDYEILGTPENINQRNQYLKFKIRLIKGGA